MNDGWIKLHRKLRDNPIWTKEKFTKGQAWVDLLLMINHKKGVVIIGNEPITIMPGQTITSEKKLAKNWKWSRHKVNNFFQLLFKMGQIGTPKRTPQFTLITIANWELHQLPETKKDTQKDIKRTSTGHQKDTNKNDKNVKNDKNKPNTCVAGNSLATREVYDYWVSKLGHTKAKYTPDRKGKIYARLKEGFSIDELKRAIDGCSASSYHMGDNDNGKVYDSIDLIFRNADKIDMFLSYLNKNNVESPLKRALREGKEKL